MKHVTGLLLTGLLVSWAPPGQAAEEGTVTRKVMVLHNATDVGVWRQNFDQALHHKLAVANDTNIAIRMQIEYSGLESIGSDAQFTNYVDILKARQLLDPADLVISVLPQSDRFLQTYGDEIFPGAKRIYSLTDQEFQAALARAPEPANGVVVADFTESFRKTVEMLPRLLPGTRKLVLLVGGDEFGEGYLAVAQAVLAEHPVDMEVEIQMGLPLAELMRVTKDQPTGTVLVMLPYERDNDGNALTTPRIVAELSAATELPILGNFDSMLGFGLLGGAMARVEDITTELAAMTLAMLSGETPSPVPVLTSGFYFDDRQLQRFGIAERQLPPGSQVEFPVITLWDTYRQQVLITLLVISIQACLIFALFVTLRRRKAAERELRDKARDLGAQKDLFASVINSIPDAVLMTREDGMIYATNQAVYQVFNHSPDALVGKKVQQLLVGQPTPRVDPDGFATELASHSEPVILEFRSADGEFTGEMLGTHIRSTRGDDLGYFFLVRDITQRLSRESESRQRQKMEALGTLVGGISHDFNNVLGVIAGYAELLRADPDPGSQGEALGKIVNATHRGSELCNQIMSFSRDMGVAMTEVNLWDVAQDAIKLLSVSVPQDLQLEPAERSDDLTLTGNFTQLEQVLMNLVTNASQAMQGRAGAISIALGREQVSRTRPLSGGTVSPGDYVVLQVTDAGVGIPLAMVNKIFDPFFTTRDKFNGRGLGMAIVYRIVKSHGGTIHVSSRVGLGTCMAIYLPAVQATQELRDEPAQPSLLAGTGERILLVDDEEDILVPLQRLLSSSGYEVEAFQNPQQALARFRDRPDHYDLLITDFTMQPLTGMELMTAMRELRANLPAILCTGQSDVQWNGVSGEQVHCGFLRKPFALAEIAHMIRRVLDERDTESGVAPAAG
jgi:PAS domain S-box-containing protein